MEFIEISAKTVDEAITKACISLETSSDNLEIQVVTEGSSGFLGFGSKPAVIRVKRKTPEASFESILNEEEKPAPKKEEKKSEKTEHFEKNQNISVRAARPQKKENFREKRAERQERPAERNAEKPAPRERKVVIRSEEEILRIQQEARTFLEGVFKAMELEVAIEMKYDKENDNLDVDFSGEDMGILIGKRGQTLDSLQYLTSLVVNKGRQGYIRVKLDTEDYRNRRKETLENLAKSIAYKVRKTRKPVSLEPMNPYERRIIHSALQGNRYVETYSEGNEPYRHVVVKLKK